VTTDRLGYIYVASSGENDKHEGRIDVFTPAGRFVTEIVPPAKISERPCRIDVDSRGRLYIAARPWAVDSQPEIDIHAQPHSTAIRYAILRYAPSSYPPTARTSYGLPIIFVLGGESYGLAVDPSTDHVYVANGPVFEYSPRGKLLNAADAVQRLTVDAKGGTFTLNLSGNVTGPIRSRAPAVAVEKAIAALYIVGRGNVKVSAARGRLGDPASYTVTFTGDLRDSEREEMTCSDSHLKDGGSCAVTTISKGDYGDIGGNGRDVDVWGKSHEIYVSAEDVERHEWVVNIYGGRDHRLNETIHAASADPGAPYPAIAVDQANGDVYVEDFKRHRINEFRRNRKSGKFELFASIEHGRFLERVLYAGSDLAVDGSPESPNQGYLFATSGAGKESHLYAFAPRGEARGR
jgi:DNA-binding beta-propeller fold protein YncE